MKNNIDPGEVPNREVVFTGIVRRVSEVIDFPVKGAEIHIFATRPPEPYSTVVDFFLSRDQKELYAEDSESRMIIPVIPVMESTKEAEIRAGTVSSGGGILKNGMIISWGKKGEIISSVIFETICFSVLLKFFLLMQRKKGKSKFPEKYIRTLSRVTEMMKPVIGSSDTPDLMTGPFVTEREIRKNMESAAVKMVKYDLVNSFFGNISYRLGNKIYISKSGAFLNDLRKSIVKCNIKSEKCIGEPSSEFPSHKMIYRTSEYNSILHGHPIFTVIESMNCRVRDCQKSDRCFFDCPHERYIFGVPVISGNTGSGEFGLDKILPKTIKKFGKAVVYGHGIFVAGRNDYVNSFSEMLRLERICREEYLKKFGLT